MRRCRNESNTVFFSFWLSHVPPGRFDGFWALLERCLAPGGRVFMVDNRWYPEYRWGRGAAPDEPEDAAPWVVRRRLDDGRAFDIVKVFYDREEVAARLGTLG
jgi:demethylmenaquinone methyltransferase/2-methoxy-6-polyprenyl-1,4-benzoquinol methylase